MGSHRASALLRRVLVLLALVVMACVLLLPAAASAGPVPEHVTKVLASDGSAAGEFGHAVAISGDTAVVGAWSAAEGDGEAYIYTRAGSGWNQTQVLQGTDDYVVDEWFGQSVAISGDTLVVGIPHGETYRGSVEVYGRSGSTWSLQQTLTASDVDEFDYGLFGFSVALSGDTLVVGATYGDGAQAGSGAAYVFTRSGGVWSEAAKIYDSDGEADDMFGGDVAVSGDTVVAGAVGTAVDWREEGGSVSVFTGSGSSWTRQQKVLTPEVAAGPYFGHSVAVSGDTLLVGFYYANGPGAVFAYTRSGGTWSQQQTLTVPDAADGAWVGFSVALQGDCAVVGVAEALTDPETPGRAVVFERSGTTWSLTQTVTAVDGTADDQFGYSVGFDGTSAIFGAPGDDDKGNMSGSAYIHSVPSMPVYRFYNRRVGSHFYTPNEAEKAYVIATWPTIYTYEGVAYTVYPPKNTQPLHRFYNKKIGSHFYTASVAERDSVIANLSAIYSYDGPTYKVSTAAATGKPPVYRFYNKRNGSHFYTASESEKASVIANLSGTYTYEGTAFWLGQ